MSRIDVAKSVLDWSNPRLEDYYTDDFQMVNADGSPPMDRDATLTMSRLMQSAMPDIQTVIEDIREDGDDVLLTSHWEGTLTNDFDLSALGIGVVPATGKLVVFPTSTIRISFEGDRLSQVYNAATGPDAGTAGFLKALGVEMPK